MLLRLRSLLILSLYCSIFLWLAPIIVTITQRIWLSWQPMPSSLAQLNSASLFPIIVGNLVSYFFVFIPICLLFHREIAHQFRQAVIYWRTSFQGVFFGCGIILIFSLIGLTYLWLNGDALTSDNQTRINTFLSYQLGLTTLLILVFAPFVEEFIFRWLLFGLANQIKLPAWLTIFLSTLSFALIHVIHDQNFIALTPYLAIGFALALTYQRYQNLWVCIGVHSLNNLCSLLLFFIHFY
ncbi:MAG: lysostaphin resistance A-like protein [Culicoidibacterales bacterium]